MRGAATPERAGLFGPVPPRGLSWPARRQLSLPGIRQTDRIRPLQEKVSTHKTPRIAKLIAHLKHDRYDPHYLGYFECFNRQMHYEAHDVLEELWLQTKGPLHHYYNGLIQLAGAFVHLKNRKFDPAARLFRLCRKYLEP